MVRTDQAYINQYLVYDEVFEACEACEKACVEADYFLRKEARKSYLDTYFSEALNFGAKKAAPAKTESNIFAKIGKAIVTLIEKIKAAIRHIKDSIFGTQKKTESANKALQKILAENPEMKKTIMKGIKKEWFTIYDVAAYKNDVVGLIKMVDQAKINNQTAMDKFQEITDKVKKGIIAGGAITGGLGILKGITEINKSRTSLQSTMEAMQHMAEAIKDDTTNNGKDPNSVSTKARILGGAVKVLIGLDRNYETNAEKAARLAEEQAGQDADARARQRDADAAIDRQRHEEAYQRGEAARKEAEEREASINHTNRAISDSNKAAQDAVNKFNSQVQLVINTAKRVKSATDPEYVYTKNEYRKQWERIRDIYYDSTRGAGREGNGNPPPKYNSFIRQADAIANNQGTVSKRTIDDAIITGRFIEYVPATTRAPRNNNGDRHNNNRHN